MTILINNPIQSTWIFISIFLIFLALSYRSKKDSTLSLARTQELKGFAILAIVFSHIGYFLVSDHQFLFPLSIMAGVGVNLFLFLSGYGLTVSKIKKEESVWSFYKRRLFKLLVPFWLVLISFLTLDFFVLHILYSKTFILQSFFGIFTHANIYTDLNSPFWYFTLILLYYILFPLVFSKKRVWISAVVLYLLTYCLVIFEPKILQEVLGLYKVHLIAFPLGMIIAGMSHDVKIIQSTCLIKIKSVYLSIEKFLYPFIMILLLLGIGYFGIHAGIGTTANIEQTISILTIILIIVLFILKKGEFKLLSIFGLYSYEIYLLHWPLTYRYDFLYAYVPGWLATSLYLVLFILLSWIVKKVSEKITQLV